MWQVAENRGFRRNGAPALMKLRTMSPLEHYDSASDADLNAINTTGGTPTRTNERPTAWGWRWASARLGLRRGEGGDAEPVILIAALYDDHLGAPFGLLDDLGGGAVRTTEDN